MASDDLKVFHHHKSTCSQKVRICLAEKQIPWVSCYIDIARQDNLTPEYLAINPNGVVPALYHKGRPIIESSVITEYLDEVFDGASLTPDDPIERAEMRAWMRYNDEVPSMAIRVPSYQLVLKKRFEAMTDEEYETFLEQNPLRADFFRKLGKSGFSEEVYEEALENLRKTIRRIDDATADAPWICGERFTLADICLAPVFQRIDDLGLMELLEGSPNIQAWYERLKARPSHAEAFYAGSRMLDDEITGDPPIDYENL